MNIIREERPYQSLSDRSDRDIPISLMPVTRRRTAPDRPLVSIVDDDESVRESLPDLVRELGYAAQAFSSAAEFLASESALKTRCLILDIMMPGMSGPELHKELKRRRQNIPVVFITAHTSEALRAQMLAQGAVDCLIKPFSDDALLDALTRAMRAS